MSSRRGLLQMASRRRKLLDRRKLFLGQRYAGFLRAFLLFENGLLDKGRLGQLTAVLVLDAPDVRLAEGWLDIAGYL